MWQYFKAQLEFTFSNSTTKTLEFGVNYDIDTRTNQWCHSGVFIANFEDILHLVL